MSGPAARWELVQPPELSPQLRALQGRRAGLQRRLAILERDPCDEALGAYRLSGPLAPVVCGLHLDRGYRLAFTMQPGQAPQAVGRVVLLYVGKREPGHRRDGGPDVWDDVHDLFGVTNPTSGHHKPPCCERDLPVLETGDLDAFRKALRRFNRGR